MPSSDIWILAVKILFEAPHVKCIYLIRELFIDFPGVCSSRTTRAE